MALANEKKAMENEKLALANAEKAKKNELEAQKNLARFQEEKLAKETQEHKSAWLYIGKSRAAFQKINAALAWSHAQTALELNPQNKEAVKHAIYLLVSQQRFLKIIQDFPDYSKLRIYELAVKYAGFKKDDELLSGQAFKDFIKDIDQYHQNNNSSLYLCNTFKMTNQKRNLRNNEKEIRQGFKALNPKLDFIYDEKRDRVTITGEGTVDLSPFVGLYFKRLALSGQKIENQVAFRGLNKFTYLNLAHSGINNINYWYDYQNLKHLNLSNTNIANLKPRSLVRLDYLNVSNTPMRTVNFENIQVKKINVRDCEKLDLNSLLQFKNKPGTIVVNVEQLKKNPIFVAKAKRFNIKLLIHE